MHSTLEQQPDRFGTQVSTCGSFEVLPGAREELKRDLAPEILPLRHFRQNIMLHKQGGEKKAISGTMNEFPRRHNLVSSTD